MTVPTSMAMYTHQTVDIITMAYVKSWLMFMKRRDGGAVGW